MISQDTNQPLAAQVGEPFLAASRLGRGDIDLAALQEAGMDRHEAERLNTAYQVYNAAKVRAQASEVISGFGRSGAFTGAEAFGVTPDILNFAKQVTNGAQPLGGVIASKEIYDTFMAAGGPEYMLEFPHGYTYSAHPVACAAGIAALDILQKEDMIGRVKALAPYFENAVHSLKGAKHVADIRNFGLAAGFTIAAVPGEPAKRPYEIAMKCWEKGFYVRYGGDTIQLAPPFISTSAEIDRLVSALGDALQETA
jgi:beta-alanine--pyruvate transaminase